MKNKSEITEKNIQTMPAKQLRGRLRRKARQKTGALIDQAWAVILNVIYENRGIEKFWNCKSWNTIIGVYRMMSKARKAFFLIWFLLDVLLFITLYLLSLYGIL